MMRNQQMIGTSKRQKTNNGPLSQIQIKVRWVLIEQLQKQEQKKPQSKSDHILQTTFLLYFYNLKEFYTKTQQQIINQMIFFRLKSSLCLSIALFIIINLSLHINTIEISAIQSFKQNAFTDSVDLQDQKICDGNIFEYLSSFVLGRQKDLTKTFVEIQKHIFLKNITYSDKVGKLYKIYNFKPHLVYLQSKQVAQVKSLNVLNISGGSVKLTYDFQWEKQQLGSSIKGNGSGLVSSDPVTFQKILETNENHELEWVFTKALPITIQNSLTLSKFIPYKELDYEIINQMLNQLKNNATTVKKELIEALNFNFTNILKGVVKQDETITIPKQIKYSYNDYRGQFDVLFDNVLLQNSLTKSGLSLLLSRVIRDYKNFECGEKVPDQPQSQSKYGGTQEYISNKFLKSTLKYALQNHFLDVTLSQDDWQSRAFQFYVGDLHEAISSTKNTSSFIELAGKCQGIDDKSFSFQKKTISSYVVVVNFTCFLLQNTTKIIDIVLPVEYEVAPVLKSSELNFVIKSIKGSPIFVQSQKFKITNPDLARFMLTQTLNMAVNSSVIGSHFKTRSRKTPQLQVRDGYLFLYDKSTINSNPQDL